MTEPNWLAPDWREKFAAMKAAMAEKAKPLPGQRLMGLDDLLATPDIADGTRLTPEFVKAVVDYQWPEYGVLREIGYIEAPNILRRYDAVEASHD